MLKVKPSRRVHRARPPGWWASRTSTRAPHCRGTPRRRQTGQTGTHHDHIRIGSHASFDAGETAVVTTSLVGGLRGSQAQNLHVNVKVG